MAIVARGADAFEAASIDEAYLDLSSLGDLERAEAHARALKAEVREREGLTCSIGIGPNKLVAKIASDLRKPDGLTVVRPEAVQAFLDPLGIRVIRGSARRPRPPHGPGIRPPSPSCAPSSGAARGVVRQVGGRPGRAGAGHLRDPVSARVGAQVGGRAGDVRARHARAGLRPGARPALAAERVPAAAGRRLRGFRTVTVTVRFEDFVTLTRSRTAEIPIVTQDTLEALAHDLLLPFFDERENPRRPEDPSDRCPRGEAPARVAGGRLTRRTRAADKGPSASLAPSARALNVRGVRLAPGLRAPPRSWTLLAAPAIRRVLRVVTVCAFGWQGARPLLTEPAGGDARQGAEELGGCSDDAAARVIPCLTSFRSRRRRRSCRRRC